MRVAVFTDADVDAVGGLPTTIRALLRYAPPDIRPRLYTFSPLEVDEPACLAIKRSSLLHMWQLPRLLVRDGVRVVHVTTAGPAGVLARYAAARAGLPVVGSLHAAAEGRRARWIYRGCEQLLVTSEAAGHHMRDAAVAAPAPTLWPQGVDLDLFTPIRRSQRLRVQWHVSERRPAIVLSARHVLKDGLERGADLIGRFGSLLHEQGMAHQLVVTGEGLRLDEMGRRCPDVIFTGRLSQSDLAVVLASADLALSPARAQDGCHALIEAQACGLPVLAAHDGAAPDNMQQGVTGYTCQTEDIEDFARAAVRVLADPERRRALSSQARRYALTRSWESSLAAVYEAYRQSAGQRVSARRRATLRLPALRLWRSAGPR